MQDLRVATVQMEHASGDKAANLAKIRLFVEQAAAQQARLVVFPECCVTGYWFLRNLAREQIEALAEPVPDGPATRMLLEWSQTNRITIGAGLVERADDGRLYNTYVVAMPDGRVERHRKLHCFVSEHMDSGDEFTVFDLPDGCRVGVLICYDNNLIENARITALAGAEVLLAPHQTGGCATRSPHAMGLVDPALWEQRENNPQVIEAEFQGDKGRGWLMRWLPSRAHDNGMFLIFSNGVGRDDDEIRTGNAMVLDPYGRVITETWQASDAMLVADLDGSLRDESSGARWLRARRPELYAPLAERTGQERDTREVRFAKKLS
jgi:predicted amidohydrolase